MARHEFEVETSSFPEWLKDCSAEVKGIVGDIVRDAGAVWQDYCKRVASDETFNKELHGLPTPKDFKINDDETGLVDGQLDNARIVFSPWMHNMCYTEFTTLLKNVIAYHPEMLVCACVPTFDAVTLKPEKIPELWIQIAVRRSKKRAREDVRSELSPPHVTPADTKSISSLFHVDDIRTATELTRLVRSMVAEENQPLLEVHSLGTSSQYYELRFTHWNDSFHFHHQDAVVQWSRSHWDPVLEKEIRYNWSQAAEERAFSIKVARSAILTVVHRQTDAAGRSVLVNPRPQATATVVHATETVYEGVQKRARAAPNTG